MISGDISDICACLQDGGYPLWGLQALTGDEVSKWKLEDGRWNGLEIRYNKDDGGATMARERREIDVKFYKAMEDGVQKSYTDDKFVDQLASWANTRRNPQQNLISRDVSERLTVAAGQAGIPDLRGYLRQRRGREHSDAGARAGPRLYHPVCCES